MVYIKFANKQNLKKHIETVHEGIKPFKCSICDVKFAINYNPLIQILQELDGHGILVKFLQDLIRIPQVWK